MSRFSDSRGDAGRPVLPFGPALLLLLPFAIFGRFVLGDELWNGDVILAYRPAHALLAEGLRRGGVPLWTAAFSGGFPLAFSEYGWFSPLTWGPLLAGGAHAGYYLGVALHVGLAGLATYGLARTWGATRAEATLGGLIFSQSLLVIGGAPLVNQAAAYWIAPAMLWVVARTIDWHPAAPPLGGVVIALGLLGGHPQVTLIAALPAVAWAAIAFVRAAETARRFALLLLLLGACAGVGVAAVRIVPTLGLLDASVRQGGLPVGARGLGSAHPLDLVAGFVFPSLHVPRVLTPHWAAYVGPLPVGLAVYAVVRWRRLSRRVAARAVPATLARRPVLQLVADPGSGRQELPMSDAAVARLPWLAVLGVLGLVLGIGEHGLVATWLGSLPVIGSFRDPSRFLLWTVTALAILAPAGMRLGLHEARANRRPARPARAARRGLGDRFRLRERFRRQAGSDQPTWTSMWFVLACAVVVTFAGASWAFQTQEPTLRSMAEARVDVGGRVLGAAIDLRSDYPPDFYRARFEASWRRLGDAIDVRQPGVAAPLLALVGAGWWWTWGRGRGDAVALAGLMTLAPLVAYGQVRLPAIAATDVALARESSLAAIAKVASAGAPDEPSRFLSWLPLATDFYARTGSFASGATETETDAVSYQVLTRLAAPNLALAYGIDASQRDPRIARLSSVDGYENLVTREQALVAAAIGSERSPATGDGVASVMREGLRARREAISRRWGILAASGVGSLVTATSHAPVEAPPGVVIDTGIVPAAGLVPSVDLHRLVRPWPRVFALTGWDVTRSSEEALKVEAEFVPSEGPRAVVTTAPGVDLPVPASPPVPVPVRVTRDDGEGVTIEVDAPAPALVVVLDALTPGWRATVDGRRAPIVPTNVAYRGVIVPAGAHVVAMTFVPDGWATARVVTTISLVILAAWLLNVGTRSR